MAVPVIMGNKSESERFAGALETFTIEALMQDGKALQAGTSHFLGQNFAKAFDVMFTDQTGNRDYVWATSWGVSTRLMGALIMAHSDDNGLVLPPKLAPIQVVIVPIYRSAEGLQQITAKVEGIVEALKAKGISVKYDDRDTQKPGWKFADYELKGVPVRLAIGERDLQNDTVEVARRDTLTKETIAVAGIEEYVAQLLENIQQNIYKRHWISVIPRLQKWIHMMNLKNCWKRKPDFSFVIGTVLPRRKNASKQRRRRLSVVFRLIPLRRRANVWLRENLLTAAY